MGVGRDLCRGSPIFGRIVDRRVPARRRETVIYDTAEPVFLPDTLTVLSWNIGYAGLGDDMDFFYDGGKRVRDSRRRTLENLRNIVAELRKADADIMLLQEVDCDSHRSYGIREVDSLRAAFPGYVLSFAYNYRAWWVPIPLRSPMGRVGSGLVTLSRVVPLQAQRVQYPSAFPFPVRLFNLKRCLLALQFRTAGGDTVLIGNTHNTAYDAGGMRDAEMRFLGGMLRRMPRAESFRWSAATGISIRPDIRLLRRNFPTNFSCLRRSIRRFSGRDSGSRTTIPRLRCVTWTLRGRRFRKTGNLGSGRRRR